MRETAAGTRSADAGRHRLSGLFAPFEAWVDPFAASATSGLPTRLVPFLWHFARQAKGPFALMFVLGGLSPLVDAALFYFVGRLIDILGSAPGGRSWVALLARFGPELAVMAFTLLVVRTLVFLLAALVDEQTVAPGFYSLVRWQVYGRVAQQSYRFFQDDLAGSLAAKVWQSGEATGDLMESLVQVVWFMAVYLATTLVMTARLDLRLSGLVTVWIIGFGLLAWHYLPRIRMRSEAAAEAAAVLTGHIVDGYANIETMKLFPPAGVDTAVARAFRNHLDAYRAFTRPLTAVRTATSLLSGTMLLLIATLCVDLWVRHAVSLGAIALALGLALRFTVLLSRLMTQLNSMLHTLGLLQNAQGLVTRPIELVDRPAAPALKIAGGAIEFDRVRFGYEAGRRVLDDFSLTVKAGEKVGIVGASGCGKTTVVNLILRLYDVDAGRILIDGQDIANVRQETLRRQIGVVSQNAILLHRSLRANIKLGRPGASEAEMIAAAEKASAHGFIETLSDNRGRKGYDAHVGERGVKLSGGQRQRIAIARIFLKNAPILLLDEATSSLDSEVEAAIEENLADLMRGRTAIVVAHRLSTLAHLDRLVVLAGGRVAENGTHAELLAAGGLYARLWARQSGGFIATAP